MENNEKLLVRIAFAIFLYTIASLIFLVAGLLILFLSEQPDLSIPFFLSFVFTIIFLFYTLLKNGDFIKKMNEHKND